MPWGTKRQDAPDSPRQPPRSDKNLAKINLRKEVVVTVMMGEKVRSIVEMLLLLLLSVSILVSTEVVVQGRGQSDSWVPSGRSSYAMELLGKMSTCMVGDTWCRVMASQIGTKPGGRDLVKK